MNYTLGFIICEDKVLLIEKQKPEFQRGFLNGLGGKIEDNEKVEDCIVREVKEECNMNTISSDWQHFCTMFGCKESKDNISDMEYWNVFCFVTTVDYIKFNTILQTEKEKLQVTSLSAIYTLNNKLLGNISWLIGMAIDFRENRAFIPPVITYTKLSLPLKF